MSKHYLDVIEYETGETIESIGPYDFERQAEKAERGLNQNLDHSRFYTRTREGKNR